MDQKRELPVVIKDMPCGCHLSSNLEIPHFPPGAYVLEYCPLHKAARELREFIAMLVDGVEKGKASDEQALLAQAKHLLVKAKDW
jgi:hypothetical protein